MTMDKIVQVLQFLGLGKNDIVVYLDLIQHQASTVLEIAKRTQLHRANIYDALRSLKEKGLLNEIPDKKTSYFQPQNPEFLIDKIKQREVQFEEIIPELRAMIKKSPVEAKTKISHGIEGIRNLALETLEQKEPILVFYLLTDITPVIGEAFAADYHQARTRKKIHSKYLFSGESERIKILNSMPHTEARFLIGCDESHSLILISGNKTHIVTTQEPISVITIDNPIVAHSYACLFNTLWNQAKSPNL